MLRGPRRKAKKEPVNCPTHQPEQKATGISNLRTLGASACDRWHAARRSRVSQIFVDATAAATATISIMIPPPLPALAAAAVRHPYFAERVLLHAGATARGRLKIPLIFTHVMDEAQFELLQQYDVRYVQGPVFDSVGSI
ncbi:hypothetical protein B0O95_103139 [Mycetohabitans endofungorum]|uniref:EAL domain-containing protein n=1 Tax=Mycetohabitans endofungorum TaxID=417203 RepID=A0A2P5KCM5_9BURK|nr:hypothetical protein B0O95_103139 [Mycetohabitans endofungorum]